MPSALRRLLLDRLSRSPSPRPPPRSRSRTESQTMERRRRQLVHDALHAGRRSTGRRLARRGRPARARRNSRRHRGRSRRSFANAGYAVLAYDARGHGASGGDVTLAGPREVADLRRGAQRLRRPRRRERREDRRLGHLLRRRPDLERAGRRRAVRGSRGGRDVDVALRRALWPQNLARSGIVAGFAASVAARSPLIAEPAGRGGAEHRPRCDQAAWPPSARRSPKVGSITNTDVSLPGPGWTSRSTSRRRPRRSCTSRGPKKLYAGNFGHPPSTFPGPDSRVRALRRALPGSTDFLKGTPNGVEAKPRS